MAEFLVRRASCYGIDTVCRLMTHGFYDWSGYLPASHILRCLLCVNSVAFRYGFLDKDKLCNDGKLLIFLLRADLKLSPEFYQRTKRYSQRDFMVSSKFLTFGKSSLCATLIVWDENGGENIGQIDLKSVFVDSETRRPCQIPKWFVEKYKSRAVDSNTLQIFQRSNISPIPGNVFRSFLRTRYSDLDENNHVATTLFFGFCIECATEASLAGLYRHFNSNMTRYPLLNMDATFIGECNANQNLTVITWQDEDNVQKIYFTIYLKEKLLFQAVSLFGKDELIPGKIQYFDSKI